MDKKIFAIGTLSITGLLLLLINLMPMPTAARADVIKDRDYQAVTAAIRQGGDGLFVIDNRTGKIGVFAYDNTRKGIATLDIQDVMKAFPPGEK
jgi:hypothetical protein